MSVKQVGAAPADPLDTASKGYADSLVSALLASNFVSLSAAVTAATGRVLVLPPTYTATLTAPVTIPANTRIHAEAGAKITVPAGSATGVFIASTGSSITGSLAIEGNGASKTADAVGVLVPALAVGVTISGLTVTNWHGNIIKLISSRFCTVTNIRATDTTRTGQGCVVIGTHDGTNDTLHLRIQGITSTNCQDTAVTVDGDWNRTDWRTAGAKNRWTMISDVHAEGSLYAGIFVNGAYGFTVDRVNAHNNGDYGVGCEYSQKGAISNVSAHANSSFGVSVFLVSDEVSVSNVVANGNAQDGVNVTAASNVAGDPAQTSSISLTNLTVEGNVSAGLRFAGRATDVSISGVTALGNADGVMIYAAERVSASAITAKGNTATGITVNSSTDVTISSAVVSGNGSHGVALIGSGAGPTSGVVLSGIQSKLNGGRGIHVSSVDVQRVTVSGGTQILSNTSDGIGPVAKKLTIVGAYFEDNGGNGNIAFTQPQQLDVKSTTCRLSGTTGTNISLAPSGGFSGFDVTVTGNTCTGGAVGIAVSAASNTTATNYFVVTDNHVAGATAPYTFSVGTVNPFLFRGTIAGDPNGTVPGAVGSVVYRSDGAAGSTLYVKETGANTTSGWVAPSTSTAASFRVVTYAAGAYPARPSTTVAPAGYVRYIGPSTPTDWLTGDEWVNNS